MQPKTNFIDGLSLATAGILTLGTAGTAGAPFGLADPAFNSPQFTSRAYPIYCRSDGQGGLLWSFENSHPSDFDGANGAPVGGLVRTTVDGVLDTNFVVGPALQETAGTALQADGKILVGGRLAGDVAANGAPNYRVFRYLTNGVRDTSYQSPVFAGPPRFMTVQPDGRLLAAWTDVSGVTEANGGISGLARLNTDGTLDSTFQSPNLSGGFYGMFGPPAVDTNGMIYIVGGFLQVNGQSRQGVARLQADGTLDGGFVPAGFGPPLVRSLLLQPGGKVVIAGRLRLNPNPGPSVTYYPLMRLNSDGSFDSSFTLVPCGTLGFSRARLLLPAAEGKMLTVSTSMARFNADGSLDNTFTRLPFADAAGVAASWIECSWFEQLADGRIILPSDPRLGTGPETINGQPFNGSVRLLADGMLDVAYTSPVFQNHQFPVLVQRQTGGPLVVGGNFDHVGPTARTSLARLNTNGVLDTAYSLAVSNVTAVLCLAPLPASQAYALIQTWDAYSLDYSNVLVRLQPDGTVDTGFNADLGAIYGGDYRFMDLQLQGGLPVLVAAPTAQPLLYQADVPVPRFLADGSWDSGYLPPIAAPGAGVFADGSPILNWSWGQITTANIGALYVGELQLLTAMATGELVAAVGKSTSGVSYAYQLLRLNGDGSVDSSFTGATLSPARAYGTYEIVTFPDGVTQVRTTYPVRCISAALAQSDGKLLVGGSFTNVNGVFRPGIARFAHDGTLDLTFPLGAGPATPGGAAPVRISGLSLDGAGKLWVTGNFIQWDGVNAPGYVRLNADGSVDPSCLVQSSQYGLATDRTTVFNGAAPGLAGDCFVFGPHLLPGDVWPRALTRLVAYPPPLLQPRGMLLGLGFTLALDTFSNVSYRLETSADLQTWQPWLAFQGDGGTKLVSDPASSSLPQRFYRAAYGQ